MARLDAFFLETAQGRRFCVLHEPADRPVRGSVLYLPPFAEEMNKSRRTVAVTARALAAQGWAVLQVDLAGCGDSEGEFDRASWEQWRADVSAAAQWLIGRHGALHWLWSLRAGSLLLDACPAPQQGWLLWQPVVSGKQHLNQFLRTKLAADALGAAGERSTTQQLRQRIAAGEALEVAGYTLREPLVAGLEAAELPSLQDGGTSVAWLEVANNAEPRLLPPSSARLQALGDRARASRAVSGLPFWQTTEIDECPALVEASRAVMQ
jgi:exosortase A-associated hydrolase 2